MALAVSLENYGQKNDSPAAIMLQRNGKGHKFPKGIPAQEHYGQKNDSPAAAALAAALDEATEKFLEENRSPSRKVNELDTRGSHFYLARYWAESLAAQDNHSELAERFVPIAEALVSQTPAILEELLAAQGYTQDLGGYYLPDAEKVSKAMRPSATFNKILSQLN